MKLHYFQDPAGNFGDDLNAWLWPRVAPGLLDNDEREIMVGIGTLINHRLPAAPLKHVMGSGVGYGTLPKLDERFVFHAVRGHGSARALGLGPDKVITDGAVLLRSVPDLPAPVTRARVNIVLTGESLANYDWASVCAEAGIGIISCHESVEAVLAAIRGSELILADAMHGAIAADTLRVPWVAVRCNENILASKWQDWLSSLEMEYQPLSVQSLFDARHALDRTQRIKHLAKLALARTGIYRAPGLDTRTRSDKADVARAIADLGAAARARPQLSQTAVVDRCVERFQEQILSLTAWRSDAGAAR